MKAFDNLQWEEENRPQMKDAEITEIEVTFKIKPRRGDGNHMRSAEEIAESFKQWAQFIGWTVNLNETNEMVEYYANLTANPIKTTKQ